MAEGIDFISVIKGYMASDEALSRVIPPMGTPVAPHLEFAGRVKQALEIPVMHASRINDVATARHAIRDGLIDLVGMTRAHIADPHIVAKIQAGEEDRIRPCVGASYCLDEIYQSSRRQVRAQRVDGTRGPDAAPCARRDRTGDARPSSSVAGPPASRRPAFSASAATRWSCSRRPTHRAARSGSPRRRRDGAT